MNKSDKWRLKWHQVQTQKVLVKTMSMIKNRVMMRNQKHNRKNQKKIRRK